MRVLLEGFIPEDLLEKVLAKEKEEIIKAYYAATLQFDNSAYIIYPKTAEQYYEER